MADVAATVAFGLLIGGQFLGAIYVLSNRSTLYPDQLFHRRSTIQGATLNGGGGLTSVDQARDARYWIDDPQRQKRLAAYRVG